MKNGNREPGLEKQRAFAAGGIRVTVGRAMAFHQLGAAGGFVPSTRRATAGRATVVTSRTLVTSGVWLGSRVLRQKINVHAMPHDWALSKVA